MNQHAILVENLSKQYRIGIARGRRNGRATFLDKASAPFRYLASTLRPPKADELVWAIQDVSFQVEHGEVVGIIGRNGAGKSTLLKILSRITQATEGRALIHGRIASLLEVGTGFHPELTGRENIYLNGAVLGMRKAEIDRKFDEIVAFSEVERFIDTPVKHYSSGMYVRLAFAVAAHLEPEILIVDEVLAVGDAAFQKKCLGKMEEVAGKGRTVLFVSHNVTAIRSLCGRAVLLNSGKLVQQGSAQEVVGQYLRDMEVLEVIPLDQRQDRSGDGSVRLASVRVESLDHENVICSTSRLKVTVRYRSQRPVRYAKFLVGIYDHTNTGIFALNSDAVGGLPDVLPAEGSVTCLTDPINLTPGRCYMNIQVLKGGVVADYVQHAGYFDVEAYEVYGSGKIPSRDWVLCVLPHKWSLGGS